MSTEGGSYGIKGCREEEPRKVTGRITLTRVVE